jgi:transcriptional regulator with XRE-family HTH domain
MVLKDAIKRSRFQTQEKFAIASGINESLLSKYVRKLKEPSKEHLNIINRLLKKGNINE